MPSINSSALEMLNVFGPNLGTVSGSPAQTITTTYSLDRGTAMAKTPKSYSIMLQRTRQ